MTPEEAIEGLKPYIDNEAYTEHFQDVCKTAIKALEKVRDYETQWLDDTKNPLEPLKLICALNSEIFKLKFRMENKPKEISILDYTIIAALQDCLKRVEK